MTRLTRISRALRLILLLMTVYLGMSLYTGLAQAERGGGRVIVLPLRGPGGMTARNEIASALEREASYVRKIGGQGAQRPARTARMHNADAMISGQVKCPGKACTIDIVVFRRSGQVWTKGQTKTTRRHIDRDAATLTSRLLHEIGVIGRSSARDEEENEEDFDYDAEDFAPVDEEEEQEQAEEEVDRNREEDTDYDFTMDDFEGEEERRRQPRRSREHEFDAIEAYVNFDITLVRNLCVDLDPELMTNDFECFQDDPASDDRTYGVSPFANLGIRVNVFPGSFIQRRRWWSHFGVYFDYGHSLTVKSQRDYETPEDEDGNFTTFTRDIPTTQQDLRFGFIYRLPMPMRQPSAPQLRFLAGISWYQFYLDDTAYPQDYEIRLRYRNSNPYLPTFSYTAFDFGIGVRVPLLDFIFPYTHLVYRVGVDAGQAERIYGSDSSIHGLDWEFGVAVEIALGIRFIFGFELMYYQINYAGDFDPEDSEERDIWGGDAIPGDNSKDLIFRLRAGVGWSF